MEKIYSHTLALCPTCRQKVNARIVESDEKIYLEKFCHTHGISKTLICSDVQWYQSSRDYVKPKQLPLKVAVEEFKGCPESCGLCPEHQQHTCLPVIEITHKCDLRCPICLKNLDSIPQMTVAEFGNILDQLLEYEGTVPVINLSGGEPTFHPDLEQMLQLALDKGIVQTTVSTHGHRFLHDDNLRKLFKETQTIVALQFDGFLPETYHYLRGRDFSQEKQEIIQLLENEGIPYSLVATVAKGINDQEIAAIVDFFFASKALSLMFQPATFTGHAGNLPAAELRLTIPDVVKEIEKSRYVTPGDFNPLPCSHFSCFALAYYFNVSEGNYLSLKDFLGKSDYLEVICNRTLPGLDHCGYALIKEKIYEFWSAADTSNANEQILRRIRQILKEISTTSFTPKKALALGIHSMKAIFIHQFMDVHTLDFGRLIKCCNHYPQADGRLLPMCALNVFNELSSTNFVIPA
ncbi:MAG: hypothetical protein BWK79_05740 [Beggiatoa sp. IS2]|nr:MAG: hypothetical protein BWK79_05740 [Beggiatoa sp. IS2]